MLLCTPLCLLAPLLSLRGCLAFLPDPCCLVLLASRGAGLAPAHEGPAVPQLLSKRVLELLGYLCRQAALQGQPWAAAQRCKLPRCVGYQPVLPALPQLHRDGRPTLGACGACPAPASHVAALRPRVACRHHGKVPAALVLLKAPALEAVARQVAARHDTKGGRPRCPPPSAPSAPSACANQRTAQPGCLPCTPRGWWGRPFCL